MSSCSMDPEVSSACSSEEYVTASSETTESCSEVSSLEMIMDVSSLTLSDSAIELEDKSLESEPSVDHTTIIDNNNDVGIDEVIRNKSPGKLFADSDDIEEGNDEDITLKDYEQKSLQTLALERRRIIENQVVRRKKIEKWTFLGQVDDTDVENKFQKILLQQAEIPPAPKQEESITCANILDSAPVDSKETLTLLTSSKEETTVPCISQDETKIGDKSTCSPVSAPEDSSGVFESAISTHVDPKSPKVEEAVCGATSPVMQDAEQPSSLTSNDSIDCTSILEKKEQLKRYWEERIMAEQDLISFDVSDSSRSPTKVVPSADVNGNAAESKESVSLHNGHAEADAVQSDGEGKLNSDVAVAPLIDVECKDGLATVELNDDAEKEGQETKRESVTTVESESAPNQVNGTPGEDATVAFQESDNVASLQCDSEESALQDDASSESSMIIHSESSEQSMSVSSMSSMQMVKEVEVIESKEQMITTSVHQEIAATSSVEEMQEISKPQVIGETYRAAQNVFQSSSTKTTTTATSITNGHVSLKSTGSYNSNNAESLIAMEIRELREREEELKQMRERLMAKNSNNAENHHCDSVSDSSIKSECHEVVETSGRNTPNSDTVNGHVKGGQNAVTRTISLDSLHSGQNYNLGYAFGHRRKDKITVKPLADQDSDEEKPVFKILNESPIQREIRLAQEREEALRREKGLLTEADVASRTQKVDTTPTQRPSTLNPNKPKTYSAKVHGGTQKVIATVRIQQEIEEQTQRELALRAAGSIQTISQERTDSKITRLVERTSSSSTVESSPQTPKSAPANKSPVSPIGFSPPDIEICEKTSPIPPATNGHHTGCNGSAANGSSCKVLSPSSSSTSNSSGTGVPAVGRRFVPNPTAGRGISMQKFISSKGKDFVFSTFSKTAVNGNGVVSSPTDYYEIKPPQVRKVAGDGAVGAASLRKGLVPAESKIQEELKEMKAREDELKLQRQRSLNISQPNLSTLHDGDNDVFTEINGDGDHPHNGKETEAVVSLKERCSSNPNLAATESPVERRVESSDPEKTRIGGPRRRSTLIAQWEQIIQGSETGTART